jgi:hypothetical protein
MKNTKQMPRQLPNYFKKIALGLIAISISLIVLSISKIIQSDHVVVKNISFSILFIAFLLLAISKDKNENEAIAKLRLQSFAGAFVFGVVMIILEPFLNFLFEGSFVSDKEPDEYFLVMFFFYFWLFFLGKRKLKKESNR